ncbi:MAG: hypothetical protein GVY35_18680 [Bacteroidetes bacterium]|jgi:hypothetical protein|nr:hypothetical protein [Bacteroidota bacterium]
MNQTLYGLVALSIVTMIMLSLLRRTTASHQRQAFTETTMQVTGLATAVFDHMEPMYFDRAIAQSIDTPPTCGHVSRPEALTPAGAFTPCTAGDTPEARYTACHYLEGFDGLTDVPFERGGFDFEVDIDVEYVDPDTHQPSATPTFAKAVTLSITNPHMHLGRDRSRPLTVEMRRVMYYDRVTDDALIPYASGSCPPPPSYPVRPTSR